MDKRAFLAAALSSTALGATAASTAATTAADRAAASPTLLTVTGAVGRTNRGAFDKSFDVLMSRHGLAFERAYAFDYAMLLRLRAETIEATLEYDGSTHALSGPALAAVLQAAGAPPADSTRLALRAVDGYAPQLTLGDARRYGFIVATHRDARPLPLGGLGPLWAIYAADRFPEMMAKPIAQRYAACPWALYHVGVEAG